MRVDRRWIFITIIAVLTIALANVGRAAEVTITLDPSEVKDIEPGGTFDVDVTVSDVSNLFSWKIVIRFDPNVLQADNVTEGPFLASTNETTIFQTPTIDNDVGFVIAGAVFMPPFPEYGVTGDGVLATIVFSVTGRGSVTLEFDEELTVIKEVRWYDYEADPPISYPTLSIPCTLVDGAFTNGAPEVLSLSLIIAIVGAVAICGVGAFFFMRRRRS